MMKAYKLQDEGTLANIFSVRNGRVDMEKLQAVYPSDVVLVMTEDEYENVKKVK
jgi:hypothetical protein